MNRSSLFYEMKWNAGQQTKSSPRTQQQHLVSVDSFSRVVYNIGDLCSLSLHLPVPLDHHQSVVICLLYHVIACKLDYHCLLWDLQQLISFQTTGRQDKRRYYYVGSTWRWGVRISVAKFVFADKLENNKWNRHCVWCFNSMYLWGCVSTFSY